MAPRVLFISHRADATGAPRSLAILLRHWLASTPWRCRVLLAEDGPRRAMFSALAPTDVWPAEAEPARATLLADLARFDPDLIYSNTSVNGEVIEALDAALPRRVPVVTHVRELGWTLSKLDERQRRVLLERTELFLAASDAVRAHLVDAMGVDPARVAPGPVAIEGDADRAAAAAGPRAAVERRLGVEPDALLVGNAGFVGKRKGPDLFVDAAAALVERSDGGSIGGRPLRFVWVGEGPDRERVQRRADRSAAAGRLRFVGHVENPQPLLARLDLLLMSSRDDPNPRVVLESAAHGVPAVAFAAAGGAGAFLEPGGGAAPAGVAVAGEPDAAALADAAEALLRDDARRAACGRAARERAETVDVSAVAPAIAERLRPLLPPPTPEEEAPALRPDRRLWDALEEAPRVSVLMTSFNYEGFVAEAIASVAAQTHPPHELLIVDDGSSDASAERIRDAIEGLPFPVRFEVTANRGQSAALNLAFSWATGDAVAFLDSDDAWAPAKLERMLTLMRICPGGGLYQHQLGDGLGGLTRPMMLGGDVHRHWERAGRVGVGRKPRPVMLFHPTSGLMAKKEVLDAVFPVPEALVTCPDAYLSRAAVRWGPLVSHPGELGTWRRHGGNAGGTDRFGFERFWVPVILPVLNDFYRRTGSPLRLFDGGGPPAVSREGLSGDFKHRVVRTLAGLGLEDVARRLLDRPARPGAAARGGRPAIAKKPLGKARTAPEAAP